MGDSHLDQVIYLLKRSNLKKFYIFIHFSEMGQKFDVLFLFLVVSDLYLSAMFNSKKSNQNMYKLTLLLDPRPCQPST